MRIVDPGLPYLELNAEFREMITRDNFTAPHLFYTNAPESTAVSFVPTAIFTVKITKLR